MQKKLIYNSPLTEQNGFSQFICIYMSKKKEKTHNKNNFSAKLETNKQTDLTVGSTRIQEIYIKLWDSEGFLLLVPTRTAAPYGPLATPRCGPTAAYGPAAPPYGPLRPTALRPTAGQSTPSGPQNSHLQHKCDIYFNTWLLLKLS